MTEPSTPRFGLRDVFIVVVLVLQIGLPASYYFGTDDSPMAQFDERFAWRMFSPVRMARCTVKVSTVRDGRTEPVRLSRELHVVWINLLKRARPSVVEAVIDRFCSAEPDADVRFELTCTAPDAASKSICFDRNDRDGDGLPDGFTTSHYCDGDPRACYARECGDMDPRTCYDEICRLRLLDPAENVCARGGA